MRLLVVEDDAKIAAAMRDGLQAEGYNVVVESTGEGAFLRVTTEPFDLVLLDLGLPGRHGLEILQALRANRERTFVLVVTARDSVDERVTTLESGADDYLVKPFAFSELLARIRALLRRGTVVEASLRVGDLTLNRIARSVSWQDEVLNLTQREFQLLEYMMRREGEVVSRESLAREVWKEQQRSPSLDNVIDVYVARLRRKVSADATHSLIRTVRGVGYMLGGDV